MHRTGDFARWVAQVTRAARVGDQVAIRTAKHVLDQLNYLKALTEAPTGDTATLKWVRQSKRHKVWRISHPYDPLVAVRTICWFDDESDTVVVVLFANDKAGMGDIFYDSVGSRADQAIDTWKRQNGRTP